MELTAIPGVGEKTADALQALDDPERALERGDVATLARAPGISSGRAARIARGAIRANYDDPGEFVATPRAREIYQDVLALLQERTVTDYATHRLETLYPSASRARIEDIRERTRQAMDKEPAAEVLDALDGVEPLSEPTDRRIRDRCLATQDAETYAHARDVIPEVSVELVDNARKLSELARGYATVVVLDESFARTDVDGDVRIEPDALENPSAVVPERTLGFFAHNRDRLQAAARVHRTAGLDPSCDLDSLETALDRLDTDGAVRGDEELDRLTTAVNDIDAAVSQAERVANDHLRDAIEERDVTIDGTDLLSLVERGAGVDSLLQRELADEYDAAVEQARDALVETLNLRETEAIARRAFGDDPAYPVEHDEEVVNRLRTELTAARDRRATRQKRELASDLAGMRTDCQQLVECALELDVDLAISRFARDFDCTMPTVGGDGFTIEGGRSPLLDVAFEDVEPVDYEVSGVTLLSGVNSGGKTSMLDLVALIVTLTHMGLPVPAEHARVARTGELQYHAKNQGTLDAGAFESTLREFGELTTSISEDRPVLVLVDELESITEPGASANIMAGILEALAERDATAVFVSHLASEIREVAETELAVDGIEASGIADGELLVDRTPVKGRLARSTPELIVEKLADENVAESDFYAGLLEKF
ncbi:helix-hairpin-helix domain-containing protein [Halovenus rubra]|uniref:DNA-binding protein MutS2 n=2 Tax=Halovenus rubra TaxID=869890 RepID=A0ABD5XB85_9EURY|nr:helix-hairpin-helix domain-containing protein [Halovenus rubra]